MADRPSRVRIRFVANLRQWEALAASNSKHDPCPVATADFDTFCAAREAGNEGVLLADYLAPEDATAHDQLARQICRRLRERWSGRLTIGSCDLPRVHAFDPFYAFACFLNISRAVLRCLDELRPGVVECFPEWEYPCLGYSTVRPPDTFNFAVNLVARHRSIPVEFISVPGRWNAPLDYYVEPSWAEESLQRRRFFARSAVRQLVFSAPVFDDEIEPLAAALDPDATVLVGVKPMSVDVPFIPWPLLQHLPVTLPPMPDWQDFADIVRSEVDAAGVGEHAALLHEKAFVDFLLKGWRKWLCDGARIYAAAELCRRAFEPERVVIPYDAGSDWRGVGRAFIARGIPTLSVDHVGLATPFAARENEGAEADAAVWGAWDAAAHRRWRDSSARVIEVGSMRRDLERAWQLGKSDNAAAPRRVLVATSHLSSDVMAGSSPPAYAIERWWTGLAELTRRYPDVDWALRTHPRFDYRIFYEKLGESMARCSRASGPLPEEVTRCAVFFLFANYSTAAVHAVLAGRPVVYFRPPELGKTHWESPMEELALCVPTVEEAGAEIERLLTDPAYRCSVVERQRRWLEPNLVAVGEEAVRRTLTAFQASPRSGSRESPDPTARGFLELVMIIDYGLRGVMAPCRFQRELRRWRREYGSSDFRSLPFIDADALPDYLMNMVLLALWRRPAATRKRSRERPWLGWYLWQVYRVLPRSIKPPLSWLVAYWRRTLEEEPLFNPQSRFWRFMSRGVRSRDHLTSKISERALG